MKTSVLLSLGLGLACAAPARAVDVKPYGFVLVNAIEEWGRPNILDVPTQALSLSKPGANGTYNDIDVRQSRVGLRVDGIEGIPDATAGAVVEGDFFGNIATASPANGVLQASPRLRLAYGTVKWERHTLTFGQDWTQAFSPLNPVSLVHQAIPTLSNSGNHWNRLPQLRWDYGRELGSDGLSVETKAAVLRAFSSDETANTSGATATQLDQPGSGESSGQPAYQALAQLSRKTAAGTWLLGLSGQYLRQRFVPGMLTGLPPSGATDSTVGSLLGSVHAALPLASWLEVDGEGFYGHGGQNLAGLAQVYADASGAIRTSLTRGGWGQATFRPTDSWALRGAYGIESLNATGLPAAAVYRNETYLASATKDFGKSLSASVEFGQLRTYYLAAPRGLSRYGALAAMWKFGS